MNRKICINYSILINLLDTPRELDECVTMEQQVRNQISFFFINYMSVVSVVRTDFLNKLFLQKWCALEEKFRKSVNKDSFSSVFQKICFQSKNPYVQRKLHSYSL